MTASRSRKGNGWDNAGIESWHSLIKKARGYLHHFRTRTEARGAIFEYIAMGYNRQRLPSALGYRTPREVAEAAQTA